MKWITAGRWNGDDEDDQFPELQIWRLLEGSAYKKLNATLISTTSEEEGDVYEYPVNPPLPFQPGDILGILTPDESGVSFDESGQSVYYYTDSQEIFGIFDINGDNVTTETGLPLVTVEIGKALFAALHEMYIDKLFSLLTIQSNTLLVVSTLPHTCKHFHQFLVHSHQVTLFQYPREVFCLLQCHH